MKFWNHSPVGMALVEVDGKFRRVNPYFEVLTGYASAELESLRWQDITLQSDVEADAAMVGEILTGERDCYTMDKTYIRKPPKNGLQPVRLSVYPMYKSGEVPSQDNVDCLLAIVNSKEPKAVVDADAHSVKVTAPEGVVRIGLDKKMLLLVVGLLATVIGWLATVQYAVKRIDAQEDQLKVLMDSIIKEGAKK